MRFEERIDVRWVRLWRIRKFGHACVRIDTVRFIADGQTIKRNMRRIRSVPQSGQNGWRLQCLWEDDLS